MNAQMLLQSFAGGADEKTYIEDVFSTYLYTGNGSTQTINNGIDLAKYGGLVWIKHRTSPYEHVLSDTARGTGYRLMTNSAAEQGTTTESVAKFLSNGYTISTQGGAVNASSNNYVSWTFRRAPKFFDVVTYTGTGDHQNIPHNLGVKPGLIIIKCTNATGNWAVGARISDSQWVSSRSTNGFCLNLTAATTSPYYSNYTSATTFNTSDASAGYEVTTDNGATYVAYLFAHDPSADGIVQCGSFTTNGSGNATVTTGWEPQFLQIKASSTSGDWIMLDSLRGMSVGGTDARLYANTPEAEASANTIDPTASGFNATGLYANTTYIFTAIRKGPMRR